jgi:5'-nucleotidase
MRILLTNDDGLGSPGISLLAAALRQAGHRVFVIAPSDNRSGASHCISFLSGPCKLVETAADTWSCSGTPADCVVVALFGGIPELRMPDNGGEAGDPPDIVISGINRGANIGTDITYSGTAAAARQGSLCGIPSLALSLLEPETDSNVPTGNCWNWDMAVSFTMSRLEEMRAFWQPNSFVNVNIPNDAAGPSALVPAFPAFRYYNDRIAVYDAPDGHRYCFAQAGKISAKPEQGSDWDVVLQKQASISAICVHPVNLKPVMGRE